MIGNNPMGLGGLGYGQTWQDVTASRASATTYYNTTGKPILVSVTAGNATSTLILTIGGLGVSRDTDATASVNMGVSGIVGQGMSYSINASTIVFWAELK